MAAPTDSVEISALTAGAALDGTEILPMVQGGATVRNPLSAALTYFNANASLAAARITSGQLALAQGGTGADLSATGGANQIVRQNSAGGVFTVSVLAAADIPNLDAGKITTGTLAVARGGTGIASYTIGDLIYASGATTLAVLAGVATGNVLLSGGVATAPAWGKVDVTAHITGIVPSANGGTGVNNAGTLTNATNTTITGGGTLALGGFTFTVPATGTASLLGTAQTITAVKTHAITDAATNTTTVPVILGHNSTGTAAASFGVGLKMTLESSTTDDQDAAQITALWTTATHASRTADIVFSAVNSAAALAEVARMTGSGNFQATGNITSTGGTFTATSNWTVNSAQNRVASGILIGFSSASNNSAVADTALSRDAAGIVQINNGTAGQWGALKAGTRDAATNTTSVGLTLGHQSTGTPAASFGIGFKMALNSDTTADQDAAQIEAIWTTATHASRTSALLFKTVNNAGSLTEIMRLTGTQIQLNVGSSTVPSITNSGLQTGVAIPTGTTIFFIAGNVLKTVIGTQAQQFKSDIHIRWSNAAADGTTDVGIGRNGVGVLEVNNGAASTSGKWGAVKCGTNDAGTNTITDGLTLGHQTTGTAAAGLGSAIQINLDSSTTADQNAVRLTAEWVVATHASRTARYKLNVYDTASREVLRGEASGSAPMIGFLGANAAVRQTSGADLTNNVTSGGTDDTIADFTDLTVYATDAATIRNDIYQLARKLKQVNDALRLYGLLT